MVFKPTFSQVTSVWPNVLALLLCLAGIGAGQARGAINLVVNGDFESGNTGFTSAYATFPGAIGVTEATYQILQNPINGNGSATSYGDHTTGTGLMMAVNGAPTANVIVWQQTVSVNANTTYDFAAYLSSWFPVNPALLDFSVNGTSIGQLQASATTGRWDLFFTTWNSGANTSANIAIVNQNTNVQGNDFALDDIFFGDPVFSQPNAAVPEPASLCIWGLGALGCAIGAHCRRKRR